MNVDIQKLKALAEAACPRDDWYEQGDLRYVDDKTGETHGFHHHDAAFVEAASPAAVLELIAEIESLRAAKNTVECRFEVSEDTLKTIRGCLASAEGDIDQLKAENAALRDAAAVAAMRIKELYLLFGRYILAMRAAVIEDEHGKTDISGMDWIFNSLAGPGQLPPDSETDAQAYFDREIVAVDKGMEEVIAFHDQRRVAKAQEARKVAGKWTKEDEAGSKAVYEQWSNLCGYVPWVEGGNSLKQDEARRLYAAIEGKVYCHGR